MAKQVIPPPLVARDDSDFRSFVSFWLPCLGVMLIIAGVLNAGFSAEDYHHDSLGSPDPVQTAADSTAALRSSLRTWALVLSGIGLLVLFQLRELRLSLTSPAS